MAVKKGKPVPQFQSEEELVAWFELEDMSDYDLEEATDLEIERPELNTITIRLDREDIRQLKARAKKVGVGHTTMARILLHEILTKDTGS